MELATISGYLGAAIVYLIFIHLANREKRIALNEKDRLQELAEKLKAEVEMLERSLGIAQNQRDQYHRELIALRATVMTETVSSNAVVDLSSRIQDTTAGGENIIPLAGDIAFSPYAMPYTAEFVSVMATNPVIHNSNPPPVSDIREEIPGERALQL
jgi:hypothetical protein